jgi:hypothetical protein
LSAVGAGSPGGVESGEAVELSDAALAEGGEGGGALAKSSAWPSVPPPLPAAGKCPPEPV